MIFKTTTPVGTEGCNISYSQEVKCSDSLKKILPSGWQVHFQWCQILFSDVQYNIDKKKKIIDIAYNQNLHIWWSQLLEEVKEKLKKMKVI